jgi:hypothetical protein
MAGGQYKPGGWVLPLAINNIESGAGVPEMWLTRIA